jgi:hypothetical protein
MPRIIRSLSVEFLKYMHQQQALPIAQHAMQWIRAHTIDGISADGVREILCGLPYEMSIIQRVIKYLKESEPDETKPHEPLIHYRYGFTRLMIGYRNVDPASVTVEELTELLLERVDDDACFDAHRKFVDLFHIKWWVGKFIAICPRDFLQNVVRWIYVQVPFDNDPGIQIASTAEAVRLGEKITGISQLEFLKWLRMMYDRENWIVLLACQNRKPMGATMVLPLKETAYQRFRAGNISAFGLRPNDIQVNTSHLLLNIVAARPTLLGGRIDFESSRRLMVTLLTQAAKFSQDYLVDDKAPISVMSIAPTVKVQGRLQSVGYRELPNTTKGIPEVPIYERVFRKEARLFSDEYLTLAAIRQLGGSLKNILRTDDIART